MDKLIRKSHKSKFKAKFSKILQGFYHDQKNMDHIIMSIQKNNFYSVQSTYFESLKENYALRHLFRH